MAFRAAACPFWVVHLEVIVEEDRAEVVERAPAHNPRNRIPDEAEGHPSADRTSEAAGIPCQADTDAFAEDPAVQEVDLEVEAGNQIPWDQWKIRHVPNEPNDFQNWPVDSFPCVGELLPSAKVND